MKLFFDTSVLIASVIESHSKHELAHNWLSKALAAKNDLVISSHTLAEMYAVLTRYPISPRILPTQALRLIKETIEVKASVVTLTSKEYFGLISSLSGKNLSGGIVYDGLIYEAALKSKAKHLITANYKNFALLHETEDDFLIAI